MDKFVEFRALVENVDAINEDYTVAKATRLSQLAPSTNNTILNWTAINMIHIQYLLVDITGEYLRF